MENTIVVDNKQKAVELHYKVMAAGAAAASALVDFCRQLKEMRDTQLYKELGHETFDEYAEAEVGIKSRQAYNYIATLERLGPKLIEENASAGITKLRILSEVPAVSREEFLEGTDIDGLTVEQLKEHVNQLIGEKEQLMFQLESSPAPDDQQGDTAGVTEMEERLVEQAEKIKDLEAGQAAAKKETKAAVDAAKKEAKETAEKAAEKKIAAAKETARKEAQAEADKAAATDKARLQAEKEAAERRAEDFEKKLGLAASTESTAFALYFEQLNDTFNKMVEQTEKLTEKGDTEGAAKLKNALRKAMAALAETIAE
ncbi:MAG: hypothetical protein ACK5L3_02945 [Oscillospiraceae bacterium]